MISIVFRTKEKIVAMGALESVLEAPAIGDDIQLSDEERGNQADFTVMDVDRKYILNRVAGSRQVISELIITLERGTNNKQPEPESKPESKPEPEPKYPEIDTEESPQEFSKDDEVPPAGVPDPETPIQKVSDYVYSPKRGRGRPRNK